MGIQYKLEKKDEGFQKAGPGRGKTLDQNEPVLSTAEKIAQQHHVGPATVKRAEKFADAVDKLPPEEREEVLSGRSGKTKTVPG